ncbi:MAG TPA: hypothetical protein PLF26_00070 [Blastocatellia bacterium]|nr:hypothetical protein [Blastocatellia bacterium]
MERTTDRTETDRHLGRLAIAFARGLWLTIVVAFGLPVLIAPFSGTASQPSRQTPVEVRPAVAPSETVVSTDEHGARNTDATPPRSLQTRRRK